MSAKKSGTTKSKARKSGKDSASTDVIAMKSVAQYPRYVSSEAREKMVARSKRAVYAHLNKITNAHINLAARGNCQSAKFLFEFAGIDKMPALAALERAKAAVGSATADDDPTKAVLSFYKKLGMTPPALKPPKPMEAEEDTIEDQPAM